MSQKSSWTELQDLIALKLIALIGLFNYMDDLNNKVLQ